MLVAGWFPAMAVLFNHAGWFLMECIRVTSVWFADWPRAYFYTAAPRAFTSALYYAVLLAVASGWLFKPAWRGAKIAGLTGLLLVWGCLWGMDHSKSRLTILPLSGGQAILWQPPKSKADLLLDCGSVNAAESITKPFLRAQGINRLPALALTLGEARQVGGAAAIAKAFEVRRVFASTAHFRSAVYRLALDELGSEPGRLGTVTRGEAIGSWKILHPDSVERFPQADDSALVLAGRIGATRVLLLSDLGRAGQQALLDRKEDLRADIVVSGLPVQGEPLGDELLNAIQPALIVIVDSELPVSRRA